MPESVIKILMDQNVPVAAAVWLRSQRPDWTIHHVSELGFAERDDSFLFQFAQKEAAIVITYDEDFADARYYPLGRHRGVVRLRVWPTTIEATIVALERLLEQLPVSAWPDSLIIIDNRKIRVRRGI
jgi:predicted nuclease of predicted toxin-antitoxin system